MTLPGVTTVLKDRFYSIARTNIPQGPRVLAIARRNTADGTNSVADLDPYTAVDESEVITTFGEGSDAHRAYLELVSGGAQRIVIIALPSDTTFNHSNASIASTAYGSTVWDDLWEAVDSARCDIVVPWGRGGHPSVYGDVGATVADTEIGFYADNSGTTGNSWAKKIADKMADITANSYPCFAVMGVRPYEGTTETMTPAQVASHLLLNNLVDHEDVTNGAYLAVVATEIAPVDYPEEYGYTNGACFYAAELSTRVSYSSPTGKAVFRVTKLRYNPTRSQLNGFVEKAVASINLDFNRTPIWTDAPTFGKDTSDYRRVTTLRIAFDAIRLVKQVAQPFVGEAANLHSRNALETAISSGLRGMTIAGALLASDFAMTYVPAENLAIVDLVLTPAFEMRNIEIRVSVQL